MKTLAILSLSLSILAISTAMFSVINVFRFGDFGGDLAVSGFMFGFLFEATAIILAVAAIITVFVKKRRNRHLSTPKLLLSLSIVVNITAAGMFLSTIFVMIVAAGSVMK